MSGRSKLIEIYNDGKYFGLFFIIKIQIMQIMIYRRLKVCCCRVER